MRITRRPVIALLPILLLAVSGCDIVTADLKARETAEWRKSYQLAPGGRVEIRNVNGRIEVQPGEGNAVEIVAVKSARAGTQEAAKEALGRIEILDSSTDNLVKVETRLPRGGQLFHMLQILREGAQDCGTTLDQQDASGPRIEVTEILCQRVP